MKNKLTAINRTLFELEAGILIFGAVCQIFMFLPEDKGGCSAGLWMGIALAMAGAVHMWWSLDRALDLGESQAVKTMGAHNVLRYCFIVAAFALIAISGIGNPLSAFLGIMSLKASAYMHFITRKISAKIYGEEILPLSEEEPVNRQDG